MFSTPEALAKSITDFAEQPEWLQWTHAGIFMFFAVLITAILQAPRKK